MRTRAVRQRPFQRVEQAEGAAVLAGRATVTVGWTWAGGLREHAADGACEVRSLVVQEQTEQCLLSTGALCAAHTLAVHAIHYPQDQGLVVRQSSWLGGKLNPAAAGG